jgi:hypothetical protein
MILRRAAAIAAVAIAGVGVAGIVTLAAGGSESSGSSSSSIERAPVSARPSASLPVLEATPTMTAHSAPTKVARRPAVTPTPPRPPPLTAPGPTIAPPTTYSAKIDVLAPPHVVAPVRVVIPSLGVDGNVVPTGVNERAELDIPADARSLVWYQYGPSPGEPGSAVISGHLDWKGVLGIFHELAATPIGERITVSYDDGSERAFTVTTVEVVDKPAVSVNGTFARDGARVLRLVTCGGEFNDEVNSYYSNVVVTAVPA